MIEDGDRRTASADTRIPTGQGDVYSRSHLVPILIGPNCMGATRIHWAAFGESRSGKGILRIVSRSRHALTTFYR